VHVPRILAQDLQQGFLLLEDLGEQVYLDHLQPERVDELYAAALRALLCIQLTGSKAGLACYDAALLQQEMQLFIDWFLCRYLGLTLSAAEQAMLQACFALLAEAALTQPQVLVHRDFHSRNLLICADNSPGIIDYQDAVLGPVTYDVVSLLRDSYISWPQAQVDAWLASYADQAVAAGLLSDAQRQALPEWFDLMGMQRHLKVVGIFARLHLRDGKSSYLADIPQTLRYLLAVAQRYPVLLPLAFFIQQRVPVEMREGVST
jgi:aminoglycoside/choline kinase family phosphotransferase